MKTILSALGLSLLIFTSCGGQKKVEVDFIQDNIDNAVAQNTIQTDIIEKSGKILNPRTINEDGSISYIPIDDWCSGFFPGSMWLTYNLTGDQKWLPLAEKYTEAAQKYNNGNLWTYTCTGCQYPYPSFHIDDYNYGNRAAGMMYKYYNVNGFLYWQTAQYYPSAYGFDTFLDPYTMAGRSGLIWNGEGCLFYPGAKYGSKNPFPSSKPCRICSSLRRNKFLMRASRRSILHGFVK